MEPNVDVELKTVRYMLDNAEIAQKAVESLTKGYEVLLSLGLPIDPSGAKHAKAISKGLGEVASTLRAALDEINRKKGAGRIN